MQQDKNNKKLRKCRNCTYDIQVGLRRCPYCGILNPTVTLKEIFITIFAIVIFMSIVTYYL